MTIVSAFLVPGSPLPYVKRDNPPWGEIAKGMEAAGKALLASNPDVLLIYSTQWLAVLDELWITRKRSKGLHVDENWHEFGDLPFDLKADVDLAKACVAASKDVGVKSRPVDFDAFPIDTGTIVANNFLNPGSKLPVVIAANNLYHDWNTTAELGRIAAREADRQGKRAAVIGVGNLSGAFFRHKIDIAKDKVAEPVQDKWNRKMLDLAVKGDAKGFIDAVPNFAREAKADMGFKHAGWIMGAIGRTFTGATVHAYGPVYGTGAAVVEFKL